jgi:hypothetical protein
VLTTRRKFLKRAAATIAAPVTLKSRRADAWTPPASGAPASASTFAAPFANNSPWKCKPVNPVTSGVHSFAFSHTSPFPTNVPFLIYEAQPTDPPVTLHNVKIPDELGQRNVTIPHWPAGIQPPGGGDSQVCIYDQALGVVHDLYFVTLRDGIFSAALYGCAPIDGSGFATPSKPNSGSRAAGNGIMGGLIRGWEVQAVLDGRTNPIKHAICLNTDVSGMIKNQSMYPAIGEDFGSNGTYTANSTNGFGMGALLMLPHDFDMTQFNSPLGLAQGYALRDYGGYVIDTATNTFSMNIDNDGYNLLYRSGSAQSTLLADGGSDWALIRDNVSQCISATGWLDGNGNPLASGQAGFNQLLGTAQSANWAGNDLLGMRGPWTLAGGSPFGHYETTLFQGQGGYVDVGGSRPGSSMAAAVSSHEHIPPHVSPPDYNWWTLWGAGLMLASPIPGRQYTFNCLGTGALTITINVLDNSNRMRTSFSLGPGQQHPYTWPNDLTNIVGFRIQMLVANGNGSGGAIKVQMI